MLWNTRRTLFFALYTFGLFALFLVTTFPFEIPAKGFAENLSAQLGYEVAFADVHVRPWSGANFTNVKIRDPKEEALAWFRARTLSVWPSLATIFSGELSEASFSGQAYSGTFEGRAGQLDDGFALDLRWNDLNLASYAVLPTLIEGTWTGRFSGDLDVQVRDALQAKSRLEIAGVGLEQGRYRGFTIPDLHFAQGTAEIEANAKRIDVKGLDLSGDELDITLRGQVYVRQPTSNSVVNATMTVTPTPDCPPDLRNAILLAKGGKEPEGGAFTFSVFGVLGNLRLK